MEDRRLSRPRHCIKGVQPVSKAVYRSGFYDKHATAHGRIRTLVLSRHANARPLRPATTVYVISNQTPDSEGEESLSKHLKSKGKIVHATCALQNF